jgi:hypothetical protein
MPSFSGMKGSPIARVERMLLALRWSREMFVPLANRRSVVTIQKRISLLKEGLLGHTPEYRS